MSNEGQEQIEQHFVFKKNDGGEWEQSQGKHKLIGTQEIDGKKVGLFQHEGPTRTFEAEWNPESRRWER